MNLVPVPRLKLNYIFYRRSVYGNGIQWSTISLMEKTGTANPSEKSAFTF